MKCPHCGMEIKSNEKTCPYCYGIIECSDHDDCETDGRKGVRKPIIILLAAIIAAVVIAAVIIVMVANSDDTPIDPDGVMARYEEYELTNREFNYYFWNDYYYHQSNYGDAPTDFSKLKSTQFTSDMTWQDYFTDSAMQNWRDICVVSDEARKNGFELPSNYVDSLNSLHDDILSTAESYGFDTVDEYLKSHFGPAADFDSYYDFIHANYLANAYADTIYGGYYDELAVEVSEPSINVRHILMKFDDFESDDAARAEAERVYQLFKDDPTEDNFAELANEHSADGGSNTQGGIYVNVCQGDMVQAFDAWCFDPSRQVGDTDIVETEYGYHIMYFCGAGSDMTSVDDSEVLNKYYEWLYGLTGNEEIELMDEALRLYYPDN